MLTLEKGVIYIAPDLHTGHIREASFELLDTALQITRRMEVILEQLAYIDPDYVSAGLVQVIIKPTSLPDKIQSGWNNAEQWVGRFLYTTRVIHNPESLDLRLSALLPSLDPDDHETGENFLFGSRERIKFLLSERGQHMLNTLNYGAHAYIESRVLRMALNKGIFLTQAEAA